MRVPLKELVTVEPLAPDRPFPLLARPAVSGVDLATWAREQSAAIGKALQHYGAVLFRGFATDDPECFAAISAALIRERIR